MKKIILSAVFGLMLAIGANTVSAQNKIGFINTEELINSLPEYVKAQKDLESYQTTFNEKGKAMVAEYQTKAEAYDKGAKTMSDAVREIKEKELVDLQANIESFTKKMNESVQKKQSDLITPILEKVKVAIKDYGKEKGYTYILDSQTLLFANEAENVTTPIKTKLGAK